MVGRNTSSLCISLTESSRQTKKLCPSIFLADADNRLYMLQVYNKIVKNSVHQMPNKVLLTLDTLASRLTKEAASGLNQSQSNIF